MYSSFRDNNWDVDLADMQSLSKCNKWIKYLVCVIDFFKKYAWVIPLKDKKGITIVNACQKQSQKEENQIKYGLIKITSFTMSFLRDFWK